MVVGPDGVELHYRKLHLFDTEKQAFAPGDLGLPVVELGFGVVGLCVCYDLRFVETARALALQGAELILVPTAWLTGFDQVRWRDDGLAPQAQGAVLQANLNQSFIACASQAGGSAASWSFSAPRSSWGRPASWCSARCRAPPTTSPSRRSTWMTPSGPNVARS